VHPVRDRAALRARRRGLAVRDRPHLDSAARSGLCPRDLQALHPEQRRRRILEQMPAAF